MASLYRLVKTATAQNVYKCQNCLTCDISAADMDIPLPSLVQMVIADDAEVLSARTLWSDDVFAKSRFACQKGLDLQAVIAELRRIAIDRGAV